MLWKFRKSALLKAIVLRDAAACFYNMAGVLSPYSLTNCPPGFHQLERKMTSRLKYELKNTHTIEIGLPISLDLVFSPL